MKKQILNSFSNEELKLLRSLEIIIQNAKTTQELREAKSSMDDLFLKVSNRIKN